MATPSDLRIGDVDREAMAAALREHFAHGRLTYEEFQDRLSAAFTSKTDRDLASVTRDLPPVAAGPALTGGPGSGRYSGRENRSGHSGQAYAGRQGHTGHSGHNALSAIAGLFMIILALLLIAVILPVALIGTAISRGLLALLAGLLFGRRGLLRRWKRWLQPLLRKRWPF